MGKASTERGVSLWEDPVDGVRHAVRKERPCQVVAVESPGPPGRNVLERMSASRTHVWNCGPGLRLPGVPFQPGHFLLMGRP